MPQPLHPVVRDHTQIAIAHQFLPQDIGAVVEVLPIDRFVPVWRRRRRAVVCGAEQGLDAVELVEDLEHGHVAAADGFRERDGVGASAGLDERGGGDAEDAVVDERGTGGVGGGVAAGGGGVAFVGRGGEDGTVEADCLRVCAQAVVSAAGEGGGEG